MANGSPHLCLVRRGNHSGPPSVDTQVGDGPPTDERVSLVELGMRIIRFEDIEAWKEARRLTALVYEMTREASFAKDFGLSAQVQRANTPTR